MKNLGRVILTCVLFAVIGCGGNESNGANTGNALVLRGSADECPATVSCEAPCEAVKDPAGCSSCMCAGQYDKWDELRERSANLALCHKDEQCLGEEICSEEARACYEDSEKCFGVCVRPDSNELCSGTSDCASGERCTNLEECIAPYCPPGSICPAVCYGRCVVDNAQAEKECVADSECSSTERCTAGEEHCNSDPDCSPGGPCATVCYGFCVQKD